MDYDADMSHSLVWDWGHSQLFACQDCLMHSGYEVFLLEKKAQLRQILSAHAEPWFPLILK